MNRARPFLLLPLLALAACQTVKKPLTRIRQAAGRVDRPRWVE